MLDNGTKRRIDNARQVLVGKVPDPKAQVEQITTALIYKFMDDMDQEAVELGGKASFFTGDYQKFAWNQIMDRGLGGHQRLDLYAEALIKMSQNPNLPQLFRDIFNDAFLPYRDPETLNLFLKEINGFTYDHSERLGDAFEYLLSVLGSQGAAGQFRTPRHIIDFIVAAVNPGKNDSILDPACGTAGFLISAYKHILEKNKDKPLSPDEMQRLTENFVGYDISPEMVRLSLVNMYLHQFPNPTVYEYDTLTSEERWDDSFDVILANPPFMSPKGGIRPHKRFAVQAKRSEVLFVDYIASHLNPEGRAGIIVPEGIIFQSSNAYKNLRKMLVEENYLYAVISLPAGVFNPYSGVKTSILLLDRKLAKRTDQILFVNIQNDGFGLGAQRREIEENDLPNALELIENVINDSTSEIKYPSLGHVVSESEIADGGEYNLIGIRYVDLFDGRNTVWPLVKLNDICEVKNGLWKGKKEPFITVKIIRNTNFGDHGDLDLTDVAEHPVEKRHIESRKLEFGDIILENSGGGPKQPVGRVVFFDKEDNILYSFSNFTSRIRVSDKSVSKKFLFLMLNEFYRQGETEKFQRQTSGIRNLDKKAYLSITIPLPPLEVQREIVEEIEGYQKIIDGARMVVENYKPRIPIDPDWPLVELGEIVNVKGGKRLPKGESFSSIKTKHPYLRVTDFSNFSIDQSKLKYISCDIQKTVKNYTISAGDLFISIAGTIGVVGMIPPSLNKANLTENAAKLEIIDPSRTLNEFVMYSIFSDFVKTQIVSVTHVVGVPKLALKRIKTLKIHLPTTIDEQISIINEINCERALIQSNERLIEIYQEKIEDKISEVWGESEEEQE